MSDIAIIFAIVAAAVVLFVSERVPVVIVALGTALALYATGVRDLGQALGGLGDPTVIFIASLFVVSGALDATGVTAWAGQLLIARAGESRIRHGGRDPAPLRPHRQTMFPGMITPSGDLVVLAVQRQGEDEGPNETVLAAGDTLLLQGTWNALDEHLADPDVVVVDSPELVRRQAVPMGAGSTAAIVVLLAMVLALATGAVPAVIAGLVAACAMVLVGALTVEQAYRSINWTTVILVGAMTPLSTAMSRSGAAELLADGLVGLVGDAGPYAMLAGLFVLTAILGQLISNTATALILFPIAVAAAHEIGISPRPVLMSVNVAAAAAFLTPVATPVNLMVMGPGGYEFGDYWKLGLPCLLLFFVVAVFLVPVFWSF